MQAKMILGAALASVQVRAAITDTFQMASEQLLDIFRTKQNVSVEPQQIVEEVIDEVEKKDEGPLKFYVNQYPQPCDIDKLQTITTDTDPVVITTCVWSDGDTWDSFKQVLNESDDFSMAQIFTENVFMV